ncbi:MAG: peptidoglycan-binding protein [Bacteroidota bacterium]|nr:peptidoglycan-binding protein [Bacteroidota bacterium]
MDYPGHTIQLQAFDITSVKAIQQQLNIKGCGPLKINGNYDLDTSHAVMLFQTRFNDVNGTPLDADGVVGPITWAALFGTKNIQSITRAPNILLSTVLDVARSQIGVVEFPSGSNEGPGVSKYQDAVNIAHGQRWSLAFVYWCFSQACTKLEVNNPVFKTGDVIQGWLKAKGKLLTNHDAKVNTSLVLPGQVFFISTGGGHGHAGLVERNESGLLTTIEGNTCVDSSDGAIGVFRRKGRYIDTINTGFIQFE